MLDIMATSADSVRIRASIPSGFEVTATEECVSVLGIRPTTTRGCIEFNISSLEQLHKVDSLRSVDNFMVVIAEIKDFCQNKSDVLQRLDSLATVISGHEWLNALEAWRYYTSCVVKKEEAGNEVIAADVVTDKPDSVPHSQDVISTHKQEPVQNNIEKDPLLEQVQDNHPLPGSAKSLKLDSTVDCEGLNSTPDPATLESEPMQDPATLECMPLESDPMILESDPIPLESDPIPLESDPMPLESADSMPSHTKLTPVPLSLEQDAIPKKSPDPMPLNLDECFSTIADEFKGNSFRVTATRTGPKPKYSSEDAARHFATGIIEAFHWPVKLKNSDIDVLLALDDSNILIGVALTRKSKHRRNLTYFGPTSLRATIAYGLLRFARPKPGDIVIDPMCGGGSISIEGAIGFPGTYHIAGDNHTQGCKRARDNVNAIGKVGLLPSDVNLPNGLPVNVIKWDVTRLPLRTASVDVIVTDMPFGKRLGYKGHNWSLYKNGLEECGRVCVPQTGRGVFMTHDTKAFNAALKTFTSLWQRQVTYWINLGGLKTGVYVLLRTAKVKI